MKNHEKAKLANTCEIAERRALECQAREKVLRDALRQVESCTSEEGYLMGPLGLVTTAAMALAQPTDDSALQEYIDNLPEIQLLNEIGRMLDDVEYKGSYMDGIKTLLSKERERCIEAVRTLDDGPPIGKWDSGYIFGLKNAISAIRALGD